MATLEETGTGKRGRRRSATRTRLWGWLLVPPALWMVVFFVSSIIIVVLLSFGHVGVGGLAAIIGNPGTEARIVDGQIIRRAAAPAKAHGA